jgi:hypothetical protein
MRVKYQLLMEATIILHLHNFIKIQKATHELLKNKDQKATHDEGAYIATLIYEHQKFSLYNGGPY